MRGKLFLIHWKPTEAEEHAARLRALGWEVSGIEAGDGARAVRSIRANTPDVVVIHLTRLPSHSRGTADALRSVTATREIPIVFVDGQGEALEKTRAKVPGAVFATSAELPDVLAQFARQGVDA